MRLDKYLSKALDLSRNEVRQLIQKGNIKVNEMVIRKKDFYIDEDTDLIYYNDKLLEYREFVYYMLNKPAGYICATVDKVNKTVVELIDEKKEIFPVGRLDKDTEGLLILTNDGEFAHRLTSPRNKVFKKYYVKSKEIVSEEDKVRFENGLEIKDGDGESFITDPAKLEKISDFEYYVYITEGKFHQVKRMFYAINNEVLYLKRVAMGNLVLDESLEVGEYRHLTNEEILLLKNEEKNE